MSRPKYLDRYRQFVLKGGKIPRSTRYNRRKRELEKKRKEVEDAQARLPPQPLGEVDAIVEVASVINNPEKSPESSQVNEARSWEVLEPVASHLHREGVVQGASDSDTSDSAPAPGRGSLVTGIGKGQKRKLATKQAGAVTDSALSLSESDSVSEIEIDCAVEEVGNLTSAPSSPMSQCDLDNFASTDVDFSEHNNISKDSDSEPLCPCVTTTESDVHFMVLNLGLKHGLTWSAQTDILKMFGAIYGSQKISMTKYLYLKDVGNVEKDITYHISCSKCEAYLGSRDSLNMVLTCPNVSCKTEITVCATDEIIACEDCDTIIGHKKDLNLRLTKCVTCNSVVNVKKPDNYFLSLSMASQFQTFLKDSNFAEKIMTYRFKRQSNADYYSDIYDGKVYKNLFENGGILSNPLNFSYSFFIDGVAYGNTSTKTIWPIYLTINELPYEERSKHIVLAGLYVGSKDPNVQTFLKPFVTEANELAQQGFSWDLNGGTVKSLVLPICCIADSVARCKILNIQTFSAVYGCTFCYNQSSRTRVGRRFTVGELAPLRTNESMRQDLSQVFNRRNAPQPQDRVHRGVKGFCNLMVWDHFDVGSNVVVDYMHNILLGCTKHHLELILESIRKKMWIGMDDDNIGMDHIISAIDNRLSKVQSCTSVIRELRSVKYMKLWRASEWRLWLVCYGIPCLMGLLKPKYLNHFSLLSKAAYTLLKQKVHIDELMEAHKMLMLFSFYFQKYFGEENMRYNIHLLSHIMNGVSNFGPLWTHNSFLYEAENKYLKKLSKNPNLVILEIAKKFLIYRSLPILCSEMVNSESTATFCDEMFGQRRLKKYFLYNDGCVLLGTGTTYVLSADELNTLLLVLSDYFHTCVSYNRMVYRQRRYCTSKYCESFKNNDSCVLLSDGQFALILKIFLLPTKKVVLLGERLLVSRKLFDIQDHAISINHIRKYERSNNYFCFYPNEIANPCIVMVMDSGKYLSPIAYGCSVE